MTKKELTRIVMRRHSKVERDLVVEAVSKDKKVFYELWQLVLHGEPPLPQRGSWALEKAVSADHSLFIPYLDEGVDFFLQKSHHDAVYRHLGKMLAYMPIPEKHHGILYDYCLVKIPAPNVAVATRAHCMELAFQIAKPFPELQNELAMVIKAAMKENKPAILSRGRKTLARIAKL